jgi:2'-5' RNA ligase
MKFYRAAVPPFELEIKGGGLFEHERGKTVLWLALQEIPSALSVLQKDLETLALSLGYKPEPRPFNPHITIARAKAEYRPNVEEILIAINRDERYARSFRVEDFSLMKRQKGHEDRLYHDLLNISLSES